MLNNDVLRSLRYLLHVGDRVIVEIFELAGCQVSHDDVVAFLKKDDEAGYIECRDELLAHFLNGLIMYKRGKDPTRPPPAIELPITNNVVLKKVRVAFALKDTDIIDLIAKAGLVVTKAELGAFFRLPSHRNYRDCGDQFLRYLFKGIAAAPPRPSAAS
ncbi:MAG: DUF1456 family protein [Deltaproteobacteria bacterium]|nr:DUF1456 family protein [Deltaproteobacteria bacterium]